MAFRKLTHLSAWWRQACVRLDYEYALDARVSKYIYDNIFVGKELRLTEVRNKHKMTGACFPNASIN